MAKVEHRSRNNSPGGNEGWEWGVLGWVLDRDAHLHPLTGNVTKGQKGGRNNTCCQILTKNRYRNTTFFSFLLKYTGQNYTNLPET